MNITVAPLVEAVKKLGQRNVVASTLGARQWADVPLALRDRAFFSARVNTAGLLQEMKDLAMKSIRLEREKVKYGEAYVDRSSFIGDMRKRVESYGIETTNPKNWGTVRDIRSATRLGLIYDMQTRSAQGFATWKADQNKDALNEYPAFRFERVENREHPRDDGFWPARWASAGASVGWDGALQKPFVALKNSKIWEALSIFGTPWPPFDYMSGWGQVDVDRDEAEALGLLGPDDVIDPDEAGFNDRLEASAKSLDPEMISRLKADFGNQVVIDGDRVVWRSKNIDKAIRKTEPSPVQQEPKTNPPIKTSKPAVLEPIPDGNVTDAELIRTAKNIAKEFVDGSEVVVNGLESPVSISSSGIKHGLHKYKEREKTRIVPMLPELMRTGSVVSVEPDRYGRVDIKSVYRIESDLILDDKKRRAVIIVRDTNEGLKYYDHYLKK